MGIKLESSGIMNQRAKGMYQQGIVNSLELRNC